MLQLLSSVVVVIIHLNRIVSTLVRSSETSSGTNAFLSARSFVACGIPEKNVRVRTQELHASPRRHGSSHRLVRRSDVEVDVRPERFLKLGPDLGRILADREEDLRKTRSSRSPLKIRDQGLASRLAALRGRVAPARDAAS